MNFDERKLKIVGKRDKERYVPINSIVYEILKKRNETCNNSYPFDFPKDRVYRHIKMYYSKAGIEHADIHSVRKTFGSLLVQSNVDIFRVSKLI